MFQTSPISTSNALEYRFQSSWWNDTVAVLRKANEARKLPVQTDQGKPLLKAQLIAIRGLYEMEFEWDLLTRVCEMASVLAEADMTSMATYLEQLNTPIKASYKTKGDFMTHIFQHIKNSKDLGSLPSVKNKKGETVGLAPARSPKEPIASSSSEDAQPDTLSLSQQLQATGLNTTNSPQSQRLGLNLAALRAKQMATLRQDKNEDEIIKKTVEFATLVKTLLPGHFLDTEAEKDQGVKKLEALKPRIEQRLTAIEEQRTVLQLQLDQLAQHFQLVTVAFQKLQLDQEELTTFLGNEGLDDRTF